MDALAATMGALATQVAANYHALMAIQHMDGILFVLGFGTIAAVIPYATKRYSGTIDPPPPAPSNHYGIDEDEQQALDCILTNIETPLPLVPARNVPIPSIWGHPNTVSYTPSKPWNQALTPRLGLPQTQTSLWPALFSTLSILLVIQWLTYKFNRGHQNKVTATDIDVKAVPEYPPQTPAPTNGHAQPSANAAEVTSLRQSVQDLTVINENLVKQTRAAQDNENVAVKTAREAQAAKDAAAKTANEAQAGKVAAARTAREALERKEAAEERVKALNQRLTDSKIETTSLRSQLEQLKKSTSDSESESAKLISSETERVGKLQKERDAAQSAADQAVLERDEARTQAGQGREETATLNARLERAELESAARIQDLETRLEKTTSSTQDLTDSKQYLGETEILRLNSVVSTLNQQLEESNSTTRNHEGTIRDLGEQLSKTQENLEDCKSTTRESSNRDQYGEVILRADDAERKLSVAQEEAEKLKEQLKSSNDERDKLREGEKDRKREIEELDEARITMMMQGEEIAELHQREVSLSESLQTGEAAYQELSIERAADKQRLEIELRKARGDLEATRRESKDLQSKLSDCEIKLKQATGDTKYKAKLGEDYAKLQAENETLRKQLAGRERNAEPIETANSTPAIRSEIREDIERQNVKQETAQKLNSTTSGTHGDRITPKSPQPPKGPAGKHTCKTCHANFRDDTKWSFASNHEDACAKWRKEWEPESFLLPEKNQRRKIREPPHWRVGQKTVDNPDWLVTARKVQDEFNENIKQAGLVNYGVLSAQSSKFTQSAQHSPLIPTTPRSATSGLLSSRYAPSIPTAASPHSPSDQAPLAAPRIGVSPTSPSTQSLPLIPIAQAQNHDSTAQNHDSTAQNHDSTAQTPVFSSPALVVAFESDQVLPYKSETPKSIQGDDWGETQATARQAAHDSSSTAKPNAESEKNDADGQPSAPVPENGGDSSLARSNADSGKDGDQPPNEDEQVNVTIQEINKEDLTPTGITDGARDLGSSEAHEDAVETQQREKTPAPPINTTFNPGVLTSFDFDKASVDPNGATTPQFMRFLAARNVIESAKKPDYNSGVSSASIAAATDAPEDNPFSFVDPNAPPKTSQDRRVLPLRRKIRLAASAGTGASPSATWTETVNTTSNVTATGTPADNATETTETETQPQHDQSRIIKPLRSPRNPIPYKGMGASRNAPAGLDLTALPAQRPAEAQAQVTLSSPQMSTNTQPAPQSIPASIHSPAHSHGIQTPTSASQPSQTPHLQTAPESTTTPSTPAQHTNTDTVPPSSPTLEAQNATPPIQTPARPSTASPLVPTKRPTTRWSDEDEDESELSALQKQHRAEVAAQLTGSPHTATVSTQSLHIATPGPTVSTTAPATPSSASAKKKTPRGAGRMFLGSDKTKRR